MKNEETNSAMSKPVLANDEQETDASTLTLKDCNGIKSTIANLIIKKSIRKKLVYVQVYVCSDCNFETANEVVLYNHLNEIHPQLLAEQERSKTRESTSQKIEAEMRTNEALRKPHFVANQHPHLAEQEGNKIQDSTSKTYETESRILPSNLDSSNLAHDSYDRHQEGVPCQGRPLTIKDFSDESEMDFEELSERNFGDLNVSLEFFEQTENPRNQQTEAAGQLKGSQVSKSEQIGDKKFTCQLCNFSTDLKTSINRHVRSNHLKVRKFKCDECTKRFCEKRDLRKHVAKYTTNGMLNCRLVKIIPKGSLQEKIENLITYVHESPAKSAKTKFACQLCNYKCEMKPMMQRHVRMKHLKDRPFECHTCKRKFAEKRVLAIHIAKNTQKDSSVLLCSLLINGTDEELEKHISPSIEEKSEQKFRCNLCDTEYKTKSGVNFINILRANFLYKRHFGSFFYVHITREKLPK